MNIVLIGYRCSGKTAVGKLLADELGKDFIDTDELIEENTGCSIEAVVSSKGWNHFRQIEKKMIETVSRKNNQVIATGGGVVMAADNVKSLKRNAWIVWLNGKPEILSQRMAKDQRFGKVRPPLTDIDPLNEITQVLDVRLPYYEKASDFKVDTSTLSIKETADLIIRNLPKENLR